MAFATITSKGQLTVPEEIREHLDLKPGDRVRFEPDGVGGVALRKLQPVQALFGKFPTNGISATVEEMSEAAEEAAAEHVVSSFRR
jgi:antitoxin PrlF